MKKRILILKSDKTDFERFYIENMQSKNIDTVPIYKYRNGLMWNLTVIWIQKLNLPFKKVFYNKKWEKSIKDYDTVIVFDRNLNWDIIEYIKRLNPEIRCIVWYWNTILNPKKMNIPLKYEGLCEKWSFDQNDCDKYSCKKNIQFYFNGLNHCNHIKKEWDAFFVGMDKGRYEIVSSIVALLEESGYSTFKGIIKDKTSNENKEYIMPISYKEIVALIEKSECIIDVPQLNQDGITLRVLEALFWKKKLITTNLNIKSYDFYNPNNILIWDNPSKLEIDNFFSGEMEEIDEKIVEKYSFESWIMNFDL